MTEANYLRDFRQEAECQTVEVVVFPMGADPKTLVEKAVDLKAVAMRDAKRSRDPFLAYDEVWCVFDVDAHPRIPDARQQAKAHAISLAISNPSFELWALLHFQDQNAALERTHARSALKQHLPKYDKLLPFDKVHAGYEAATKRAGSLRKRREAAGDLDGNPSTGVDLLTIRLRTLGKPQ